jgi:3-methyladenine DNA glycosylase/8-oxoguanine DNA glycosylase
MKRSLPLPERYRFAATVGALALSGDPSVRVAAREAWWATRTPEGPATLHLRQDGDTLEADAVGPGAGWALARADAVAGLRDDLTGFAEVAAGHPLVKHLAKEYSGLRLPATGRILAHLVPTIIGQKVTGLEARRSFAKLVRHFGEPAPAGSASATPAGLLVPPDPAVLAATPYWVFHPFGVEQRRADTIVRAAQRATALENAPDAATASRRLTALPGIGPWSAAEVVRIAFGDSEAVSVGDYNLPHLVSWGLAGEARGSDERMAELLAPFAGHRARVVRLLELGGPRPPGFGPRMPVRSFTWY